jgi:hypothetical protein
MQRAHLRRTPEQTSRAALGGIGSNSLGLATYGIKVSEKTSFNDTITYSRTEPVLPV